MKRFLCILLLAILAGAKALAQDYSALEAKLQEYLETLKGEDGAVQSGECDFLIESVADSLMRQHVALWLYAHYIESKIMGDDAVAVHIADTWFLSGKVKMKTEEDLLNAKVYSTFNRQSLIGMKAPSLELEGPEGERVVFPPEGERSVLYFYDTGCSTCRVENLALSSFLKESALKVYAVYTGSDPTAWKKGMSVLQGAVHAWDPKMQSSWQLLYGVLSTPKMFLVGEDGIIKGRGLDVESLRILLEEENYSYGAPESLAAFDRLFESMPDPSTREILDVIDTVSARTAMYPKARKVIFGDFLYYLSRKRSESFREAISPFCEKYIFREGLWTTPEDTIQVMSLARFLCALTSRTPVGSTLPSLKLPGTLRRHPTLFSRDSRKGVYDISRLGGKRAFLVFYSAGCSSCKEMLMEVDRIVSAQKGIRVLLVDMDSLLSGSLEEEIGREVLDSFDLSYLPMVIEADSRGKVLRRYVDLLK